MTHFRELFGGVLLCFYCSAISFLCQLPHMIFQEGTIGPVQLTLTCSVILTVSTLLQGAHINTMVCLISDLDLSVKYHIYYITA